MSRTYLTLRTYSPRALAALGVMVAVAACGGSSATPPASTTNATAPAASGGATATPTAAGVVSAATLVKAPAGNGGSAPVTKQHAPQLQTASARPLSVASTSIGHAAGGGDVINGGTQTVVVSSSATGGSAGSSSAPTKTAAPKPKTAAPTETTPKQTTVPAKTTSSVPPTHTVAHHAAPVKTIVHTVYRNKVHTVYRNKVHTVIHTHTVTKIMTKTVTKTLRPNAPTAAFLSAKHPALAQPSFTVAGSNIGCEIGSSGARCSIQARVWAAPAQPARCRAAWGDTISLPPHGAAKFVCGGSSEPAPNAKVIPDGWDDTVGAVTCQVRSIGVDCFSKTYHGFIISRTGYATY